MDTWSPPALVALCLSLVPGLTAQGMGTIHGVVTTKARAARPIRVTFDQKVCGAEVPDPSIAVDAAGHLANVVVTLTGVKARAPSRVVSVVNDKCTFVPRVQVVAPNGTVKTSSKDPVLHTTVVQQMDGRQLFNVALPMPGIEINKPLTAPGIMRGRLQHPPVDARLDCLNRRAVRGERCRRLVHYRRRAARHVPASRLARGTESDDADSDRHGR